MGDTEEKGILDLSFLPPIMTGNKLTDQVKDGKGNYGFYPPGSVHYYLNNYGKPGKVLVTIGIAAMVLMILPKIWAKRTNLFVCALGMGYAIKSYILYVSCYNAYCPEKKIGIYLMFISTIMMLVCSAFPDMKLDEKKK